MTNFSKKTKTIVDNICHMSDFTSIITTCIQYHSAFVDDVYTFVLDQIEDSQEFYEEEKLYLFEKVKEEMQKVMSDYGTTKTIADLCLGDEFYILNNKNILRYEGRFKTRYTELAVWSERINKNKRKYHIGELKQKIILA